MICCQPSAPYRPVKWYEIGLELEIPYEKLELIKMNLIIVVHVALTCYDCGFKEVKMCKNLNVPFGKTCVMPCMLYI